MTTLNKTILNNPSPQPKIWFRLGMLIINGTALDAEAHSHNAIQLMWPISQSVSNTNGLGEYSDPKHRAVCEPRFCNRRSTTALASIGAYLF